jgi:hypothetical protein
MFRRSLSASFLLVTLLAVVCSCRYGRAPVRQPSIDASSAGKLAMEQYDTNDDGKVAGDELEKAPALKGALMLVDTDGDKGVTADEVAARVKAWKAMQTALTSVRCHVTLNGQPLADAQVVFEPEPFLGESIKTATGKTNQLGDASPSIGREELPSPNIPGGVHFGLYKVRISKVVSGKETVPARYNTETVLGQEVSYDDPGMKSNNVAFALKSP